MNVINEVQNYFSLIVLIMGLVPMCISAIFKEKHYTQFWDGFWNFYGLILVLFAILNDVETITKFLLAIVFLVVILIFLYYAISQKKPNLIRDYGASIVVLPGTIMVILFFYFGLILWAIIIAVIIAVLLFIMKQLL